MFFRRQRQQQRTRQRHIYALLFANSCCYVGQSVNLSRRLRQHRHKPGGWGNQKFTMIKLGCVNGTYAQAEEHEFAWRLCAQKNGWTIYGLPPNIVVNPQLKATRNRLALAQRCVWPKRHKVVRASLGKLGGKIVVAVGVWAALVVHFGWTENIQWVLQHVRQGF